MKRITLHRHKDCVLCAKMARMHQFFDWLGRLECTTAEAPSGPLRMGEIEVVDHRSGVAIKGIEAVRTVARQIPAYWPLLPLLYLPPVARKIDGVVRGCDGESCGVPTAAECREEAASQT